MRIEPLGDRALVVHLGHVIDEATFRRVRSACARLDRDRPAGVRDVVPGFASVTVHYDPARLTLDAGALPHATLAAALTALLSALDDPGDEPARTVEIPVCYGGAMGPDLDDVARRHDLDPSDVVAIHSAAEYVVHLIGFVPGFPYLGGLDPRLATPRRDVPRMAVPAGSVGIGGAQTGVYPIESPGGWHLIGRTPLRLFAAEREPPALLRIGDRVRFRAIGEAEYHERAGGA